MHVLVAAAGQIDEQDLVFFHAQRDFRGIGQRMARFKRGDDAFQAAQVVERLKRLVVGHRDVFGAAAVLEPGVLRADAGVIKTRGNRVRLDDLAILVLQQISAVAVQHAGLAGAQRRRVLAAFQPVARGLDADQAHRLIRDVGIEKANRVRAAADARQHRVGLAPRQFRHLLFRFAADHRLEVAHHHRIRMRPRDGADDVKSVFDVGHPVAHRLVQSILQGPGTAFHGHHGRTQQLHAVDVLHLAPDVFRAHVDHAFHAVARGDGGSSHAVHAGTGLGNYPRLAHAAREQRLADAIVDLVRAGVVQVFALEIDLRAAEMLGPAPGVVNGARAANVMLELVLELGDEFGILLIARVGVPELIQRMDQRLGHEHTAIGPEVSAGVGQVIHPHFALLT